MFARLTSYPPLGHETLIKPDENHVTFKISLEAEDTNRDWEVQVWSNIIDRDTWSAHDLRLANDETYDIATPGLKTYHKKWYEATLPAKQSRRPAGFTLRFRTRGEQGWKWVHDQSGVEDGTLIFQSPLQEIAPRDLQDCFEGLSSDLEIEQVQSDTPDTRLWSIETRAAPAKGEQSGTSTAVLGAPKYLRRWFSLVRLWSPWLAPRQGKGPPFAEKDSVLYSFLRGDGTHLVALAISGVEDVLTVFRHEHDRITIHARNDRDTGGVARVLVAIGNSFEEANAAVMYRARRVVAPYLPTAPEDQKVVDQIKTKSKDDVKASWVQDWYDGFTYCTWNGLGQDLTEEKILTALSSLEEVGIRITNLIIDDNWQSLDNSEQSQFQRGWTDFEGNLEGFPDGMKVAIDKIRKKYPDLQHIGVWHALLGYWGGVSPHGKIAKNYTTETVEKRKGISGGTMTVVSASDCARMYNDFYTFLLSCGIDAVKTDAQFFIDEVDTAPARRSLTSTYLSTWASAQLRHFGATAISCMSQCPQILFPYQLPTNAPAIPVRNSDDFFPEIEESHPWHIFCNAHNSLMAQHLNVLPDWDMFQTDHAWAGFHAAGRAISGGPIYVTDEPGRHNLDLISQMTAQTCRGQTVILRPSVVGKSVGTYIGFEEERLLKVQTYDGGAGTGTAFLGLWNCRSNVISEVIPLADFMGLQHDRDYIIRSHRTGTCAKLSYKKGETPTFGATIGSHAWDLLAARPVHGPFELGASPVDTSGNASGADQEGATNRDKNRRQRTLTISNLGLIGKMTGAAAIVRSEVGLVVPGAESASASDTSNDDNNKPFSPFSAPAQASSKHPRQRLRCATTLKALGTLGVWVEQLDDVDLREDMFILLEGKPVPFGCLGKSKTDERVLEIDVLKAWGEMGLKPGWSNQVDVEIFLS